MRRRLQLIPPLLVLSSCSTGALAGVAASTCTGGEGRPVRVLASATGSDPKPALRLLEGRLRDDVEAAEPKDGPDGAGVPTRVISGDGTVLADLDLTPRRKNCDVERSDRAGARLDANLAQVERAAGAGRLTSPEFDFLEAIGAAVAGVPTDRAGTLYIVGAGLSTAGMWNMTKPNEGLDADPQQLANALAATGSLPNLRGWEVVVVGAGRTAGPVQVPLPGWARSRLEAIQRAILVAAGAEETAFLDTGVSPVTSVAASPEHQMSAVNLPGVDLQLAGDDKEIITLQDRVLGFGPNNPTVPAEGREFLVGLAARIATLARSHGSRMVSLSVSGFCADPASSTPGGREQFSLARARNVLDLLSGELGVQGISVSPAKAVGLGTPEGFSARNDDGSFDEERARSIRKVEIEISY